MLPPGVYAATTHGLEIPCHDNYPNGVLHKANATRRGDAFILVSQSAPPFSGTFPGLSIFDFASILNTGSAFDQALAGDTAGNFLSTANFDIASIVGTGSTALAGSDATTAGSFDLAAVFGDILP